MQNPPTRQILQQVSGSESGGLELFHHLGDSIF
jgi:hypothetical protein